ncbi:MAG TPA: DUF488 domain-containing protein [Candidatus Colwellbacteria bacterium]|jgi:uncharacterized protein YeaO (DUF488 family)|nr:DUF488 domain-containing protein [Candidatus Colwellbacteria bacterium]
MINLKRIYEPYSKDDGFRILVDRLWPRGVSKEKAKLNLWLKDIGPSNELRKWFNHEVEKWPEFKKRYKRELRDKKDLLEELKDIHREHKKITLLYAAKDEKHNEAIIIKDFL